MAVHALSTQHCTQHTRGESLHHRSIAGESESRRRHTLPTSSPSHAPLIWEGRMLAWGSQRVGPIDGRPRTGLKNVWLLWRGPRWPAARGPRRLESCRSVRGAMTTARVDGLRLGRASASKKCSLCLDRSIDGRRTQPNPPLHNTNTQTKQARADAEWRARKGPWRP